MRSLFRNIGKLLKWGFLLVVVLAAIAAVVVSHLLPTEIDRRVHNEIVERFPHLDCEITRTEIADRRGVAVYGVTLYDKVGGRRGERILTIDEVLIDCPTSFDSIVTDGIAGNFSPTPTKVTFHRPTLYVERAHDKTFPVLQKLRPAKQPQHSLPIEVVDGKIVYTDAAKPQTAPLTVDGIGAMITPNSPAVSEGWNFRVEIASHLARRVSVHGNFNSAGDWDTSARVEHLTIDPAWLEYVTTMIPPDAVNCDAACLNTWSGTIDANANVVRDAAAPLGMRFEIDGTLRHAAGDIPQLNQRASSLAASFHVTDESVKIDNLSGQLGRADLVRLVYTQDGLTSIRGATLETEINHFAIDDLLVRRFAPRDNANVQAFLKNAEFATTANVAASLVRRDGKWRPVQITLQGTNTSLCSRAFPYRVDHLSGWLTLTEDQLKFALNTSPTETTPIHLEGNIAGLATPGQAAGKVKVLGQHIAITSRLIELLPNKPRQVVSSLHPEGNLSAMILVEFAPQQPLKKYVEVGLERCSIRYDKFPYPLTNLDGFLVMQNDRWTFNNIIGQHESATVRGFGHIFPRQREDGLEGDTADKDYEFFLNISAVNLPLDGDLTKAILNKRQRDIVTGIRAKGKVNLDAKISYLPSSHRLSVMFTAVPMEGVSICPVHFPYPLTDVKGTIQYVDGRVKIDDFSGRNKDVRCASSIECRFGAGNEWSLSLDKLTVDRLTSHRELQQALPPALRTFYDSVQLEGAVNLAGWVGFSQGPRQETPLRAEWDVVAVLHNNTVNVGLQAKNVFGQVGIYGRNEEGDLRVGGTLRLDQATVLDLPFTDITGPFYYSTAEDRIYVGPSQRATYRLRREQLRPPSSILPTEFGGGQFDVAQQPTDDTIGHNIEARLCGGHVKLVGDVVTGKTFRYQVAMEGSEIQLPQLVSQLASLPAQRLEGKLAFQSRIHGEGRRLETLGGSGKVWLTDADVYELPSVMRLFQVLRLDEPKRGAFNAGELAFTLQGNRAILDPVYFDGDTLSLCGRGDLQIDTRRVDLLMGTRVGNRSMQIPVVSDLVGMAGDQLVQLRIEGVLGDLNIQRVTLPDIRQAITVSRQESDRSPGPTPSSPAGSYYVPPQADTPKKQSFFERFSLCK
ncbi:MAG: hypothetical protein ACRC46_15245 [Thermoguttaceae bacterium]